MTVSFENPRCQTSVSEDGRTVLVTLRVDRGEYEFARSWAAYLFCEEYPCTVESELENFLSSALSWHMNQMDWEPPAEIEARVPRDKDREQESGFDDDIPF